MIVALTIIIVTGMLCGVVLKICYWEYESEKVNHYTLDDVKKTQDKIRGDICQIKELIRKLDKQKEQNNDY